MSENQKQNLADIIGVLLAGVMLTISLGELIPAGNWLYLLGAAAGIVIVTNKVNRIIRSN
jgi:hypothetical protein